MNDKLHSSVNNETISCLDTIKELLQNSSGQDKTTCIKNFIQESEVYKTVTQTYHDLSQDQVIIFAECLKLLINDNLGTLKNRIQTMEVTDLYYLMLLTYYFNINGFLLETCGTRWMDLATSKNTLNDYNNSNYSDIIECTKNIPLNLSKFLTQMDPYLISNAEYFLSNDITTEEEQEEHNFPGIIFDLKNNYVLVGNLKNNIEIYNRTTEEFVNSHCDHLRDINVGCFSPDENIVASGSKDTTIKLWYLATNEISTLRGHEHEVCALCFSNDGQYLFSGDSNGCIIQWNLEDCSIIKKLQQKTNKITALCINNDNTLLAFGTNNNQVYVHNLKNDQLEARFSSYQSVNSIFFISCNYIIACYANNINLLSLISKKDKTIYYNHDSSITTSHLDNKKLIICRSTGCQSLSLEQLDSLEKYINNFTIEQLILLKIIRSGLSELIFNKNSHDLLAIYENLHDENNTLGRIFESLPRNIIIKIDGHIFQELYPRIKPSSWNCNLL